MIIAFTICSNNYLAQAKVLIDSIRKLQPAYKCFIGLVDIFRNDVDYGNLGADEIIPISDLFDYKIDELIDKYNIVELNTAVKPFYFKYFIRRFREAEILYYFDPDIKLHASLNILESVIKGSSLAITPHILTPISLDDNNPQESLFLNYGLYNLGFLGLNPNHYEVNRFLDWWGERTFNLGYDKVSHGLFVDQLWINYVPIFFKDVSVLNDLGYNMGPWNLHERVISSINGDTIKLENGGQLKFYHYSSFNFKNPDKLSKYYDRYSFESTGLLKIIYDQYLSELILNNIEHLANVPCHYIKPKAEEEGGKNRLTKVKGYLKKFLN